MKLDAKKYDEMRKAASPPSPLLKDCLWAFFVGGAICLLGEGLRTLYAALGFTLTDAGTLTSATLIGLSAFTTAMGWYQKLAAKAGEGGRLFGAVTSKEIAEALSTQFGLNITKTKLVLDEPIKACGGYQIKAKLGYEIVGTVNVLVVEG